MPRFLGSRGPGAPPEARRTGTGASTQDDLAVRRFTVTGNGVTVAVAVPVLAVTGLLLGFRTLLVLAVGTAGMLLAALLAVALRPRVDARRQVSPQRVTVGEPALGRLELHNGSRWPSPGFVAVDRVDEVPIELPVRPLAGGGRRTVHYPVPAHRRGRVRLGPLTVERRDPLGLVRRAQRQTGDDVLWVHPRVHPVRPLPVGVVLDYEGRTTEYARLGTVTFATLRGYVAGDDPRQIHWRSTARTGTLTVREHVDTSEPTMSVLLDTRADAVDADAFEHAVEVVASVTAPAAQAGRPVVLHILDEDPALVARSGAQSLPDRLALARRGPDGDVLRLVGAVKRVPSGGSLVVVTGDREAGLIARLAEQRRRFTTVVVVTLLGGAASDAQATTGLYRRSGLTVITAATAAEAAATWNRMIGGDAG